MAITPIDLSDFKMPRVQAVLLPILRTSLMVKYPTITIGTWTKDVERRTFPLINLRRLSGLAKDTKLLDFAVVEMTAYLDAADGGTSPKTEQLYLDARYVIEQSVKNQVVVPDVGHFHSFFETFGPTEFDSPFNDTWRVQGLFQLGIRPPRT